MPFWPAPLSGGISQSTEEIVQAPSRFGEPCANSTENNHMNKILHMGMTKPCHKCHNGGAPQGLQPALLPT